MNVWYVHKYIDTHNHEMARSTEVGFMFSHCRISELQKKNEISMLSSDWGESACGISPPVIRGMRGFIFVFLDLLIYLVIY
jgi:hypothetical protein